MKHNLFKINSDMKFRAVPNGFETYNVSIIGDYSFNPTEIIVCESTLLKNITNCGMCNVQIQENVNGEWTTINLDSEGINNYAIQSDIRIIHSHNETSLPNPYQPDNLW